MTALLIGYARCSTDDQDLTAAAALICLLIGGSVALFPHLWVRIFSEDAEVLAIGSQYMRIVAPLYPLFGAGLALYFASQGAGQSRPVNSGKLFVRCSSTIASRQRSR